MIVIADIKPSISVLLNLLVARNARSCPMLGWAFGEG